MSAQNAALLDDIDKLKPVEIPKTAEEQAEEERLAAISDPLAHAGLANPMGLKTRIEPRVLQPGELLIQNTENELKSRSKRGGINGCPTLKLLRPQDAAAVTN